MSFEHLERALNEMLRQVFGSRVAPLVEGNSQGILQFEEFYFR